MRVGVLGSGQVWEKQVEICVGEGSLYLRRCGKTENGDKTGMFCKTR